MENISAEEGDTSPLSVLIDRIERILLSPERFTSSSALLEIHPLLQQISKHEGDELEREGERVRHVETWCAQLQDATQAAYSRERITSILDLVQSWGPWNYESLVEHGEGQMESIIKEVEELPIEWLKQKVTGISCVNKINCRITEE
jgi:hypothetical protein